MEQAIYLILENGKVFEGKSFGARREVTGEAVFTTAMTGYLETLTDPSYYGQMVVHTFPLIGNYGVIPADFENRAPRLSAYIVREWCQVPSNFRSEGDLDTFLKEKGVVGLYGVDTRALTKILREQGVMNARITFQKPDVRQIQKELFDFSIRGAVESVSIEEPLIQGAGKRRRVVLWDFGAKENIVRELVKRDCEVIRMPQSATAQDILRHKPDGLMLSNGPGDPQDNPRIVEELSKLCDSGLPTFGICLGHQLLALSQGASTEKLKYGHRGGNQPVKDLATGRVFITSQNHGYAVVRESLPKSARESFVNANDGTNEGIRYLHMPAFSVQFHPEASCGPRDTMFLFDEFIRLMDQRHGS